MMTDPNETGAAAPRILLVDDDPDSLSGLARLLQMKGFNVATAADGRTALARLDEGVPFDIVLTDLMLPDIDGVGVAIAARSSAGRPIVALATGDAQFDLLDPARREKFDRVFFKPLFVGQVLDTLRQDLARRRSGG